MSESPPPDELPALLTSAIELLNVMTTLRVADLGGLWRLGGSPLEHAYTALKAALDHEQQAQFAIIILRAQLEGWEAACALQIQVLRDVDAFLRYDIGKTAHIPALLARIEEATETNAGQTLLAELAHLSADIDALRVQLAQAQAALVAETAARVNAENALYERDHGEPPF